MVTHARGTIKAQNCLWLVSDICGLQGLCDNQFSKDDQTGLCRTFAMEVLDTLGFSCDSDHASIHYTIEPFMKEHSEDLKLIAKIVQNPVSETYSKTSNNFSKWPKSTQKPFYSASHVRGSHDYSNHMIEAISHVT